MSTVALTCGKNDLGHNEVQYLKETLDTLDSLHNRDTSRRLRGDRDGEAGVVVSEGGMKLCEGSVCQFGEAGTGTL